MLFLDKVAHSEENELTKNLQNYLSSVLSGCSQHPYVQSIGSFLRQAPNDVKDPVSTCRKTRIFIGMTLTTSGQFYRNSWSQILYAHAFSMNSYRTKSFLMKSANSRSHYLLARVCFLVIFSKHCFLLFCPRYCCFQARLTTNIEAVCLASCQR